MSCVATRSTPCPALPDGVDWRLFHRFPLLREEEDTGVRAGLLFHTPYRRPKLSILFIQETDLMGSMRFRVSPPERITEHMVQQAYLSGFDRVSWPVQTTVEGDELILQRSVSDSGNLHVAWPVEGYGQLTLTSGSLIERDEPYLLPLELARGLLVEVRNQLAEWQAIGLTAPPAVQTNLAAAVEHFSWAAVTQDGPSTCAKHAEAALRAALAAGEMLVAAYSEQAISVRRRNDGKLSSFLAADLGDNLLDNYTARQFLLTFNAAELPIRWRSLETTEGHFSWSNTDKQIEWCRTHGLKVLAGPLLLLDPLALPDWLYLYEDDFESVLDFVTSFVRKAVERYRGKVDYWICAGRVNSSEVLALSEQARLRLVARTVELVCSLDPATPVLVSFDQPWAEYMRQRESDFPPLHFADALIRADLGLTGLMMEINVGQSPGGSLLRHPLEFNRLLDAWSLLGLPLWLSLSAPGAHHEDPLAQRTTTPPPGIWTTVTQQAWATRLIPLSLAKPMVQGVVWNQLRDSEPHDFPHAGLFDDRRHAKLLLRTLAAIRQTYLK
jgi:hypothetical protein